MSQWRLSHAPGAHESLLCDPSVGLPRWLRGKEPACNQEAGF